MARFTILDAPSVLGLWPSGVETLPAAVLKAGLQNRLAARHAGLVTPPPYLAMRDPVTQMRNPDGLHVYARQLARALETLVGADEYPVVLGGDCSILLGPMLCLRRWGRYGLLFLDGHMDFYSPSTSPTGEAADMDLALVTGRGPAALCDIDGCGPYVRDEDAVAFGYRDEDDVRRDGGPSVTDAAIHALPLAAVRAMGVERATEAALAVLARRDLDGFWIHLDVDVIDDETMPAVDYRMPGGLTLAELGTVLRAAVASGRSVGITVTIFNPTLDTSGRVAETFVSAFAAALTDAPANG